MSISDDAQWPQRLAAHELQAGVLSSARLVAEGAATQAGRLLPEFDACSGMLSLVSDFDSPWPRALNIDHLLLVDADRTGRVQQIELLIPAKKWCLDTKEFDVARRLVQESLALYRETDYRFGMG